MRDRAGGRSVKMASNGEYYIFKNPRKYRKNSFPDSQGNTEFLVRGDSCGMVSMTENLYCPKKLIGKRVRFKVEVVYSE